MGYVDPVNGYDCLKVSLLKSHPWTFNPIGAVDRLVAFTGAAFGPYPSISNVYERKMRI